MIAKKADKTNRLCIDFSRINNVLLADAEPIPNTESLFAKLATKRIFSKLDLATGYWQVPLDDASKPKTALSTTTGLYQFRYMPFGIKTAPAIFTKLMREVLKGIPNVSHFYDDVLVASESWEQHFNTLRKVSSALKKPTLQCARRNASSAPRPSLSWDTKSVTGRKSRYKGP